MKLICTITGAKVEASAEAAEMLVASGCFRAEEAEQQRPKRAVKKTSDEEDLEESKKEAEQQRPKRAVKKTSDEEDLEESKKEA